MTVPLTTQSASASVHEAIAAERRRIARELHDRVGLGLSVAYRQLDLYELHARTNPVKASNSIAAAHQALQEAMHTLRNVTWDLRLGEPLQSLEKALLSYLEKASCDVTCRLRVTGDEAVLSPAMRDEVFLIVREAVRNALNHGAPAEVVVTLAVTPHELRASVRDDGVGFSTQDDPPAHGLGLPAMRERAELVGGTIAISSGPGGTHVQLVVPLPETPK